MGKEHETSDADSVRCSRRCLCRRSDELSDDTAPYRGRRERLYARYPRPSERTGLSGAKGRGLLQTPDAAAAESEASRRSGAHQTESTLIGRDLRTITAKNKSTSGACSFDRPSRSYCGQVQRGPKRRTCIRTADSESWNP